MSIRSINHAVCYDLSPSYEAAANAASFNADPKKGFVIAGQSAGGNLALIATHWARDDPFFVNMPLTGQLVQYPPTCHPEAIPEE